MEVRLGWFFFKEEKGRGGLPSYLMHWKSFYRQSRIKEKSSSTFKLLGEYLRIQKLSSSAIVPPHAVIELPSP